MLRNRQIYIHCLQKRSEKVCHLECMETETFLIHRNDFFHHFPFALTKNSPKNRQ